MISGEFPESEIPRACAAWCNCTPHCISGISVCRRGGIAANLRGFRRATLFVSHRHGGWCGGRSSVVERLTVAQEVAGSIPVAHPNETGPMLTRRVGPFVSLMTIRCPMRPEAQLYGRFLPSGVRSNERDRRGARRGEP